MVKRVTIVKTTVEEGSGDSGGSGKVKSVMDAMEVTNVVMACKFSNYRSEYLF